MNNRLIRWERIVMTAGWMQGESERDGGREEVLLRPLLRPAFQHLVSSFCSPSHTLPTDAVNVEHGHCMTRFLHFLFFDSNSTRSSHPCS